MYCHSTVQQFVAQFPYTHFQLIISQHFSLPSVRLSDWPNDRMMKAELMFHLFNVGDEPRLKSEQVTDELWDPPNKRMSVQPHQTRCKVGWDGLRHVRRSWVETVDNRQLNNLHLVCASYNVNSHQFTAVNHRDLTSQSTATTYCDFSFQTISCLAVTKQNKIWQTKEHAKTQAITIQL